MAAKRTGLGKGLDSLIPGQKKAVKKEIETKETAPEKKRNEKVAKEEPQTPFVDESTEQKQEFLVSIKQIKANKDQPRKEFDESALKELSESIRRHGVLQPLLVRRMGKGYEIIAGERRFRAAKLAGLKEVPVLVRDFEDEQRMEISLIENIQREDLNPIEEALAYQQLIETFSLTQQELADRVGKGRPTITNMLRLLDLDPYVQKKVAEGALSMGQARAIASVSDPVKQRSLADLVIKKQMNVRAIEKLLSAKKPTSEGIKAKKIYGDEAVYLDMIERMQESLGSKVSVTRQTKTKGKLEIEYYSVDDLDRIYQLILAGR